MHQGTKFIGGIETEYWPKKLKNTQKSICLDKKEKKQAAKKSFKISSQN